MYIIGGFVFKDGALSDLLVILGVLFILYGAYLLIKNRKFNKSAKILIWI